MLGYIKTDTNELRVREHHVYRALYCGLCKRMGKCTGNCSRLSLSYDFVFLATLRYLLTGEELTLKPMRCLLHPLRPRRMAQKSRALDDCADASALLTYRKLLDDLQDERGLRRLRAAMLRPWFWAAYKRAARRHPTLDASVKQHLDRLGSMERGEIATLGAEEYAEEFGHLMGDVFAEGLTENQARIAFAVGDSIGRWIYLIDAADDFAQDARRGRFNALSAVFGSEPRESDWENLRLALTAHLMNAERALLLIDDGKTPELREILFNILYLGLPATAQRITKKDITEPKKRGRL